MVGLNVGKIQVSHLGWPIDPTLAAEEALHIFLSEFESWFVDVRPALSAYRQPDQGTSKGHRPDAQLERFYRLGV